jgi:tripartite-type tricarboxylate transporter receptor subunit TctC
MEVMNNAIKRLVSVIGIACGFAVPALAQDYPNRPIELVIPYAAGGGTDVLARLVGDELGRRLGQRVVPDNRPGAGTAIGAGLVARAAPNGYTLLFSTMAHALSPTMNPNLPFDSVNDFEFIGKVGQAGMMIATSPQHVKVDDLRGLVGLMSQQPGKLSYGSAGVGTPMHLGGELLKQTTRTDAIHVPYKGESAALADLIGGQVSFMFCSVAICGPRAQDGSLKGLAVTAAKRSPLAPAIPTAAEAGYPGIDMNTWYFVAAPKGTPAAVVNKLTETLNHVLADEKLRSRVQAMGMELEGRTSSAATKALVQAEIVKWRPIVKASGATID